MRVPHQAPQGQVPPAPLSSKRLPLGNHLPEHPRRGEGLEDFDKSQAGPSLRTVSLQHLLARRMSTELSPLSLRVFRSLSVSRTSSPTQTSSIPPPRKRTSCSSPTGRRTTRRSGLRLEVRPREVSMPWSGCEPDLLCLFFFTERQQQ